MKVCPTCGRKKPQHDPKEISCPKCREVYTEEADLPPVRLSDEDLDKIAKRVLKSFEEDHFERLAAQTLQKFTKGDWKLLANQVWKSLNLVYHGKQVGTMLLGTWQFWSLFALIVGIAAYGAFKLAPEAAREKAVSLFNGTVTNEINAQFKDPRISNIVVSVASNEATNLLLKQIYPTIKTFQDAASNSFARFQGTVDSQMQEFNASLKRSQLTESNLQAVLSEMNSGLRQLDQDSEFVTKVILAENDDRAAYEQLLKWRQDSSFRHQSSAGFVAVRIANHYYGQRGNWIKMPWEVIPDSTNRYSWNIEQVNAFWNLIVSAFQATDYIDFVWGNTNVTKEQRISFLRHAYLKDSRNSLQAANAAATFVSETLGAKYNPSFEYSDIESRWLEFSKTNHLFTISTNESSNAVYEIVSSSETNSAMVLTNWGETKLVLFKLNYPPVPGSIDAMYLHYGTSEIGKMKWGDSYLNTVWAKFNKWDDGLKCEFKYERDLSSTNVQSVSFITNTLILDGFPRGKFP